MFIKMRLGSMSEAMEFQVGQVDRQGQIILNVPGTAISLTVDVETGEAVRYWRNGSEVLRLNPERMKLVMEAAKGTIGQEELSRRCSELFVQGSFKVP